MDDARRASRMPEAFGKRAARAPGWRGACESCVAIRTGSQAIREGGQMKRFVGVAIAAAVFGCGLAACKKAHDAGNDSMRAGGARIVASGGGW